MHPFITILIITNRRLTLTGITIFDITNLSRVSYCFVSFQGLEGRYEAPLMTPLSARTYLEAYYDLTDPKYEDLLPVVESFQGWDLIPASVLEDAWPEQGWEETTTDAQDGEGEVPDLKLLKLEDASKTTLNTLRGLTMDTVLQTLLDSPEADSRLMDEAGALTDFLPRLKDKLYEQAPTMGWSPYHLDLLCQALENEFVVDLSPLTNVPAKELAAVVEKLSRNGKMKILNLSNRPDISLQDLRQIIGPVTDLRILCLLEMPQIPPQSLQEYLVDFEIHHSDLLRLALRTSGSGFKDYSSHVKELSTKLRTAGVVSQMIWTGLGRSGSFDPQNYLPNGRIAWESMEFSSETYRVIDGQKILKKRTLDLCVPLPPYKLIPGVLQLLQWAGSSNLDEFFHPFKGMACSLASLLPHSNGTGHGISLLNPSLYLLQDPHSTRIREVESPFCLEPGKWALLLVSEAFDEDYEIFVHYMENMKKSLEIQGFKFTPRKATSYALVKRVPGSGSPEYMVADIPTFLEDVLGDTPMAQELLDAWTAGFPSIRDAEFFGDDTYKILRKLSPEDSTLEGKEAEDGKQGTEHDSKEAQASTHVTEHDGKEAQDSKQGTEQNGKGGNQAGSTDIGDRGPDTH